MERPAMKPTTDSEATRPWAIEVFFDGGCPLCRREIDFVRRLDRRHRIRLTDISAPGFSPAKYEKTRDEFMSEIHGLLPDGSWITGVEVFRRIYAALGFRIPVALTRLPVLSQLLDAGYRLFAVNRLKWTGRCAQDGSACGVEGDCQSVSGANR
jgi:predicted DCC family thiol-disulfide oxidoreductase YuxK